MALERGKKNGASLQKQALSSRYALAMLYLVLFYKQRQSNKFAWRVLVLKSYNVPISDRTHRHYLRLHDLVRSKGFWRAMDRKLTSQMT